MSPIVSRVSKVFATTNTDSLNGTVSVASKVSEAIRRYQISDAGSEDCSFDVVEGGVIYETSRKTAWKVYLAENVAAIFGCAVRTQNFVDQNNKRNRGTRYSVVGRSEDCELSCLLFSWIVSEVERLNKFFARGRGYEFSQNYCESACRDILHGMVDGGVAADGEVSSEVDNSALFKLNGRAAAARLALNNIARAPAPSPVAAPRGLTGKEYAAYIAGVIAGRDLSKNKSDET